jgi:predicted lipid-binding transport protein (Tim44 family)
VEVLPPPEQPPAPIFKISLANATLLSAVYLAVAALTDVLRRVFNWRWAELASEHLEEFPARTLRWAGLFGSLRGAYLEGLIGPLMVRVALGLTMVVLIYALAMFVGVMMWVGRWAYEKTQPQKPAGP